MRTIKVRNYTIQKGGPFTLISGPCVIESREHALQCAHALQEICAPFPVQLIFKASYDKANRSSIHSFRGPGIEKGLAILQEVRDQTNLPILTDIHSKEEALLAGSVCDMVQIPAFLSRQTDLLVEAATHCPAVNIKKGQFLSPWDMRHIVEKCESAGCKNLLLTDRGTSFGYNNLVSDMRAIPVMQSFGYPVCFDASHSAMLPGALSTSSGGQREFIPTLARAAVAAGCNVLFLETHPNPEKALSDAATVFPLQELPSLLRSLLLVYEAICAS